MKAGSAVPSLLLALAMGFTALTAIALVAANPDLVQGRDDPVEPAACATPAPPTPGGPEARPCGEPPAATLG